MTDFIRLKDKKIEARWCGDHTADRPVLIFLHEGLGCVRMWKDFPDQLCGRTGCPGLVFSRLGYGASDPDTDPWDSDFMHKAAAGQLPALIRETRIREYILIGHSDGGSIALLFAAGLKPAGSKPGSSTSSRSTDTGHSPPGLRAVITEAAHVFCEDLTCHGIRQARKAYEEGRLKPRLAKYHGDKTDTLFRDWCNVWLDPEFLSWNIEAELPSISVPVLAIQGKEDHYGTQKQVLSMEHRIAGVKTVFIPDCRHSPHLEKPDEVISIMTAFILQTLK